MYNISPLFVLSIVSWNFILHWQNFWQSFSNKENIYIYIYIYILDIYHCVKSVQIRSVFWSVFFRIRTKYGEYGLSLRSQSEYRKMRIRKKLRISTLFTQCIKHVLYTYVYDIYIYIYIYISYAFLYIW